MRPRRWLRLLSDFDCKIRYHPGKASVAADALSRNERAKPLRVRALVMTINLNLQPQIQEARVEALKKENIKGENLHGMGKEYENRLDGTLYIRRRSRYIIILSNFTNGPIWKQTPPPSHGFYHKPAKDNKPLLHDLGNRDHQKNYADVRRKPLEFQVGVGTVAYQLELPEQLSRVHSTFHASNLKKCLADESLAIPLDEIQIDEKLHFIEEPVEVMDREVKRLKQSRISIVKVRWNSRRGPEFTWEREDQMQKKYPHLFTNSAPAAEVAS
ncbi:hypothetical protein Tco_0794969 [Tanacetum coccineum]